MTSPAGRLRPRNWTRTVIAALVVLVLVLGVGVWWWRAHRSGVTFTAMFTASVGVYPGSDVRVLGVPVGLVDSVTPDGAYVKIGMHLDPDVNVEADTDAVIISPNLVSDRYVQLTGVYTKGTKLRSGSTIPASRTKTPVELDDLYRSLLKLTNALGPKGANSHGALSRLINTGAANLGGNGSKLNDTITQLSQASDTLAGSKNDIFATIDQLGSFTANLARNNRGLVTVNNELASVTQTLADDRQTFGDALHHLAIALNLVQDFVRNNRAALSDNVTRLSRVAQTLADQRASLVQSLQAAPLLVQNFINAYDPQRNLLRGRVNLNELTLWANRAAAAGRASSFAAPATTTSGTSSTAGVDAPPSLLPAANVTTGSGR